MSLRQDPWTTYNEWFAETPTDQLPTDDEDWGHLERNLTQVQWLDDNCEEMGNLYAGLRRQLEATGSRLLADMSREDFIDVCEHYSDFRRGRRLNKSYSDPNRPKLLPG